LQAPAFGQSPRHTDGSSRHDYGMRPSVSMAGGNPAERWVHVSVGHSITVQRQSAPLITLRGIRSLSIPIPEPVIFGGVCREYLSISLSFWRLTRLFSDRWAAKGYYTPPGFLTGSPIVPDLELDALKEAVRWPKADVSAVMILAGRLMAGRRDAEGLAYFRERAASEPGRALYLALEGVFQARQADSVSLFRRVAWVNDAVAKLDRAVALDPGLPRYLRGIVLAGLPERFGRPRTPPWPWENPTGRRLAATSGRKHLRGFRLD